MGRDHHSEAIAEAIRFLGTSHAEQPELAEVAQHVGMSKYHFQRLFQRWAGVSPKRFLQLLTLEDAKALLQESEPILRASLDVGLSGPSRLHDLFVSLEAVTPGEFKTGGEALEIHWALHESPFGPALVASTKRGVCHLSFLAERDRRGTEALAELQACWPRARLTHAPRQLEPLTARIFPPAIDRPTAPLAVLVKGTNFQIQVWRALLAIPSGKVTSYGRLAQLLGKPGAARAVGSAVARNPVSVLIPCHRVIRETGHFGQYRWGTRRKKALLAWEMSRGAAAS